MLLILNKTYGVLCQFTDAGGRPTLADLVPVPGVYPAGRLDFDSEGLLLLTDDGMLQRRISHPDHGLPKTYLAQVEGEPDAGALRALAQGVMLRDGPTRPAGVRRIPEPGLWPRPVPIRVRRAIPTCWIELTLREGRNRQVRRMTAAVGYPTLRLVRWGIGALRLDALAPGAYRAASAAEIAALAAAATTPGPGPAPAPALRRPPRRPPARRAAPGRRATARR